jgi:hypothetical protein
MSDLGSLVTVVAAAVVALAMLSLAALKAWNDWLDVRRLEVTHKKERPASPTARLELADLKDRVKRLEAIADGIEDDRDGKRAA